MFVFDILKEVGYCFGGFVRVKLHHDVTHVGSNFHSGGLLGLARKGGCYEAYADANDPHPRTPKV